MEILFSEGHTVREARKTSTELINSSLHCLISKLAHPLETVRVAAFESLQVTVAKGKLNVANSPGDTDLLLRSLLEWFNLPGYTHGEEVLDILIKLSQDEFMRNYLLELGAAEFMQQLRFHSPSTLWPSVDLLLCLLMPPDPPVTVEKTSRDCVESTLPSSFMLEEKKPDAAPSRSQSPCQAQTSPTPEFCQMMSPRPYTADHFDAGIDPGDPLNIPCFDLEPVDKKYLFDVSVRLKCLGNQQSLEAALKEFRDVAVDFYPEVVFQELKYPEILITLIQELHENRVSRLAFDIVRVLVNEVKVTLTLYSEPVFRTYPDIGAKSLDINGAKTSVNFKSYPLSSEFKDRQQDTNGCSKLGCVVPLNRTLHFLTLQLIALLTDANYHVPTLSVLQSLLPLLQTANLLTLEISMQFSHYFRAINNVLDTFRERGQLFDGSFSKDTATQHCFPVLNVLCFTADLISLLEPSSVTGLLPSQLVTSLTIVAGDAVLAECTMCFQQKMMPYLPYLDPDFLRSYHHSNIAFSFRNELQDLLTSAETVSKNRMVSEGTSMRILFEKMLCMLPYIGYTNKEYLTPNYVRAIIELLHLGLEGFINSTEAIQGEKGTAINILVSLAGDLLLSLLSSSSKVVRQLSFEALLEACRMEKIRLKNVRVMNIGEKEGINAQKRMLIEFISGVASRWMLRSKTLLVHIFTCALQDQATSKHAAELMLHLIEDLSSSLQEELLPALPWIVCCSNFPEVEAMAERAICLLLKTKPEEGVNIESCLVRTTSGQKKWLGLSCILMPLFSRDDWERYQAGKHLLECLQKYHCENHDSLWFSFYDLTNPENCSRKAAPAGCKDPFQHCLLYNREEFVPAVRRPQVLNLKTTSESPESLFFKKKSMDDLHSIFRDRCGNSSVRRPAIEQLIRLFDDSPLLPPFDNVEALAEDLVAEISCWIRRKPSIEAEYLAKYEMDELDREGKACLGLLNRLVITPTADGASTLHACLLKDPAKFIEPLLPLIFHPSPDLRHEMAIFLSFLLFSTNVLHTGVKEIKLLEEQPCSKEEMYYWDMEESSSDRISLKFFVPVPFFKWYQFPYEAIPVKMCNIQEAFQFSLDESFIYFRVSQLSILSGGSEKAFQMLKEKSRGSGYLSISELQILTSLEALCPEIMIRDLLKQLSSSKTFEEDLRIMNDLERLLPHGSKAGELLAREQWIDSFRRFLTPPKSTKAVTLLLKVLRLVELLLLTTTSCTSDALLFLAMASRTALVPTLSECISLLGAQSSILTDPDEVEYAVLHFLVSILGFAADSGESSLFPKVACMLAKGTDLLPTLSSKFARNRQSPYLCCVLAVQCICHIAKSESKSILDSMTTYECDAEQSGSPAWLKHEDDAKDSIFGEEVLMSERADISRELVDAIVPLIKFLARFCSKDRVSLRYKQLVREAMYCLWCISSSVAPSLWQQPWVSAGTTFWLSKLANDQEARVRGMTFAVIALLASNSTPITREWLKQNWPEFEEMLVQTVLNTSECYAVRQECLRFVLANLWTPVSTCTSETSFHEEYKIDDYSGVHAALERHEFWERLPFLLIEEDAAFSFRVVVMELILKAVASDKVYLKKKALCNPSFFEALMQQLAFLQPAGQQTGIHHCILVAHAVKLLAMLAYNHDSELDDLIYNKDTITKLFDAFCHFSDVARNDASSALSSHSANTILYVATALNLITFELLQISEKNVYGEFDSIVLDDSKALMSPPKACDELLKSKGILLDELVVSSGPRLFRAALTVLKNLPRLKALTPSHGKRESPPWRIRMAVCALMCTLLSEGKAILLVEKEHGEADEELMADLCESLLLELEDTYAFSLMALQADLSYFQMLPALLAVGTALQNLFAYSTKAKNTALKLCTPKRLIAIAYEARSRMFDKGIGNLLTGQKFNLSSYDLSSPAFPTLELHTGAFPDIGEALKYRPGKTPDGRSDFFPKGLKFLLHRVLLLSLRLMKNLVYNSSAATEASIQFGLLELVRSLWRSSFGDEDLLHEMLGLLCNLTAQSDSAKDVIASEDCQSKGNLMSQVFSLILQPTLDKASYLLAVGLLQSLMTKAETRAAFLRKKQLPVILSQLNIATRAKDPGRQNLLLQLLVNITAHPYGQHMVLDGLSSNSYFDMVLDIIERGGYPTKTALFLLRNLGFSRESRPYFLLNERTLPLLVNCTLSQNLEEQAYAASALWVLIANGHKVAKVLKTTGSLPLLTSAEARVKADLARQRNTNEKNDLLFHAHQCLSSINQLAGAFHKPILNYTPAG